MTTMTCEQAHEQLDLLAADACDPPERRALEQHLQQCPACTAVFAHSRQIVSLLDLHWSQAGLDRLRERIERPVRLAPPRLFTPFVHRAVAMAAMLLITVGLIWSLPTFKIEPGQPQQQFALAVGPDRTQMLEKMPGPALVQAKEMRHHGALTDSGAGLIEIPLPANQRGDSFRLALRKAVQDGKPLPPPPAVPLTLTLTNKSEQTVEVRLVRLWLDIDGRGVLRLPAVAAREPALLPAQLPPLKAGAEYVLHLSRLAAGTRRQLQYVYLTEPGEYKLTPRLSLTVNGRAETVTGKTVRITVGD